MVRRAEAQAAYHVFMEGRPEAQQALDLATKARHLEAKKLSPARERLQELQEQRDRLVIPTALPDEIRTKLVAVRRLADIALIHLKEAITGELSAVRRAVVRTAPSAP